MYSQGFRYGMFWNMGIFPMLLVGLLLALTGCAATIDEHHHVATFDTPTPSNPTGFANVLKISIKGRSGLTNVRYIAGNYNENAADLFLNSVKSQPYDGGKGLVQGPNTIFDLCIPKNPKSSGIEASSGNNDSKISADSSLCNSNTDGDTFLIIMSTNADAIAETIGAFAENEATIKSLNYLLNREVFDAQQLSVATASQIRSERTAIYSSLQSMFNGYEKRTVASNAGEIAILQALAVALYPTGKIDFANLKEAKLWFASVD